MFSYAICIFCAQCTLYRNFRYASHKGYRLPENIVAVPDLAAAVKDATMLILVLAHQFLPRLLPTIKEVMTPGAKAISLIKVRSTGRLAVHVHTRV